MATNESIKSALTNLEYEFTRASCLAAALSSTHAETDTDEAPWVWMHQDTIRRLDEATQAVIAAINKGSK